MPAQPAGVFNQNITGTQAGANWTQALNIWTTPWGFLKGAAANAATARRQGGQQVVSFSPANLKSPSGQTYTVTGYINDQNLVTKVETRVENAVVGDLLVEFEYANYRNMNGVQVPARIVQKQAGMATFDAAITAATPNPPNLAELLTPPPPAAPAGARRRRAAGGRGAGPAGAPQAAAGPPPVERLGEGVFKIGGNYTSLAIDMGDHILVIESGQNDARGTAVMAAAKQAIPGKPIRFVVNSHPHFDHAGGLGAAVAEGATILTHRNNEQVLERLLAGPRTLHGRQPRRKCRPRRTNVVQRVGDRDVRKGSNGKVVELVSDSQRAQQRSAGRLPAGREDAVDRGHHRRESDTGAARRGQVGGRDHQSAQARFQRVDSGAPAESGQAADQGGRARGGGGGQPLVTCDVRRANVPRATCTCHVRNVRRRQRWFTLTLALLHVARGTLHVARAARRTWHVARRT